MDNAPIEARCDHCKQTRPLFLYEPDHNCHLIPVWCEWCEREKQPLLCVPCWGKEREREENTQYPEEAAMGAALAPFFANNARYAAQKEADKAVCDGIARATEQAEGSAS